jgi:hypothetical protein
VIEKKIAEKHLSRRKVEDNLSIGQNNVVLTNKGHTNCAPPVFVPLKAVKFNLDVVKRLIQEILLSYSRVKGRFVYHTKGGANKKKYLTIFFSILQVS